MRSRSVNGLAVFFFFALLFCDFCFYFEREQRSKAALQVCNGPTATAAAIRKIYANCRRQCERRERESERAGEAEKSVAEAATTQIKSNFQFPELAKIDKFTAATRATHTQTETRTYTFKFAH